MRRAARTNRAITLRQVAQKGAFSVLAAVLLMVASGLPAGAGLVDGPGVADPNGAGTAAEGDNGDDEDRPPQAVASPYAAEGCYYLFIFVLIGGAQGAPPEFAQSLGPATELCGEFPASTYRYQCESDRQAVKDMNANSPYPVETAPGGLAIDTAAELEDQGGASDDQRISKPIADGFDCQDRRGNEVENEVNLPTFDFGGPSAPPVEPSPAPAAAPAGSPAVASPVASPVPSFASPIARSGPVAAITPIQTVAAPSAAVTPDAPIAAAPVQNIVASDPVIQLADVSIGFFEALAIVAALSLLNFLLHKAWSTGRFSLHRATVES